MNFKQAILTDNAISFIVFLSLMFQQKKKNEFTFPNEYFTCTFDSPRLL